MTAEPFVFEDEDVHPAETEPNAFHEVPRIVEPVRHRAVDGATFVRSVPEEVPSVWGDGGRVLQAEGEAVMIVGPDGVGKTTIAQGLTLHRIGVGNGKFLGHTVKLGRRVLYIAADRPRQAASSMRRMLPTDTHDELLRERLIVWRGPLEFDIGNADTPRCALADFAESFDVSDVFIDSLKDVAVDLIKDEVGSRVNVAIQETIARGIEVCVLHHQRKAQQGGSAPKTLADVYGSRWLTAGMGSVLCVWGDAGDLVVELRHLKQPAEEVGPLTLLHDHAHGLTTVHDHVDLEQILANAAHGLVVSEAASLLFATADPTRNEVEKARRRLEALIGRNIAERRDDPDGLARYFVRVENHA